MITVYHIQGSRYGCWAEIAIMAKQESKAVKQLCLAREVANGVVLLERGLGEVQALGYTVNEYHPALLLLASGSERLMKAVLCLFHLASEGDYPICDEMKKWGHDLEKLLELIRQKCIASNYADHCAACKGDVELLGDEALLGFLKILANFGQCGRYHNFDVVGGNQKVGQYPESQWLTHQLTVFLDKAEERTWFTDLPEGDDDPLLIKVKLRTVILIERFARAIARMFMLGPLGQEGKQMHTYIGAFLNLTDNQLGQRDYQ